MKLKLLLSAVIFFFVIQLEAQNIFLDSTFNASGTLKGKKVISSIKGSAKAVAVDGLGRIIMVVSASNVDTSYVIRLKSDGISGVTSGADTLTLIVLDLQHTINSLLVQPDGKILLGGSKGSQGGGDDMMVIRLNADGTRDRTFGINGLWTKSRTSYTPSLGKEIALQSDGKIIVAGTIYLGTINKIFVVQLNSNGTEDSGFINFTSTNTTYSESVFGLAIHKDRIIVGGSYYNGQNALTLSLVKLLSNGDPISGGNWTNGRYDMTAPFSIFPGFIEMVVQNDGDIFIGASYNYNNGTPSFNLLGILSNGAEVVYPDLGPSYGYLTDLLLDKDEKLILSGYRSVTNPSSYYIAMKIDELGKFDSTFAMNGSFSQITTGTNSRSYYSALSKDGKLLLVGDENTRPSIIKVHLKAPMHIHGSEYVLPNSSEKYKVELPAGLTNYTFQWKVSGYDVFMFTITDPKVAPLFFGEGATQARLTCIATPLPGTSGLPVMKVEKEIFVNRTPTSANELDSIQCPATLTTCGTGYIDYFKLNLLRNDSSGCSSTGYSDYTQSSIIDTLIVGGVYSANLRVDNQENSYVGIWIDYNNDGIFNTSDEFVAEQFSKSSFIQINNIVLKNESGYFGPKRMRVRCRSSERFNSMESCPTIAGEGGETEDYLVVLVKQDNLSAPQIITPNDDGKNDFLVIRGVKPDTENKLMIFDRWGKVKYSAENYENNWGGVASNGDKLIPGTYYYLFTNDGESIRGFLEVRY